jgi:hypothetical protein
MANHPILTRISFTLIRRHARACRGHPRLSSGRKDVDGRDKPGHDALLIPPERKMHACVCAYGDTDDTNFRASDIATIPRGRNVRAIEGVKEPAGACHDQGRKVGEYAN